MSVLADLVVSHGAPSEVASRLSYKRRTGRLERVGRAQFTISSADDLLVEQDSANSLRLFAAMQKHINHIVDNAPSLFQQFYLSNIDEIPVRNAGIESVWHRDDVDKFMGINLDAVTKVYPDIYKWVGDASVTNRFELALLIPSNPQGLLAEAYARARKNWVSLNMNYTNRFDWESKQITFGTYYIRDKDGSNVTSLSSGVWRSVSQLADAVVKPLPAGDIWRARADILAERRTAANDAEDNRKRLSHENFTKYWGDMKGRMSMFVNEQEVRESFKTVPLLPSGTASSRTWGIEVETVQAQYVSRPAGWDERGDGSLESVGVEDCSCGCDSCYEGDHYDCSRDADCTGGSCAEFVSPILNHFNSAGLRSICEAIEDKEVNSTPGIHIHVGAGDLSVVDVARLVRAYSAVSPYIWPIMDREAKGYCKDVTSDNVSHWLAASRRALKQNIFASAVDVVYQQPDDRYRDLNLQALRQHGTIEFRAMGPTYNYEHLVRWAWFCREMVNVSRLDLPQSLWTKVRSMSDVLGILFKYGSEGIPESWIESEGGLGVEEDSESESE